MFNKAYLILGSGMLAFYALAAFNGWELGTEERVVVPADVRSSPGWSRSHHYNTWVVHSGYRGGK